MLTPIGLSRADRLRSCRVPASTLPGVWYSRGSWARRTRGRSKARDLAQFTILADTLVVAAGKPILILPQMVRTGAVVIGVGINRLPDGRLVGDVDFEGVRQKASCITPVPGGVGPMTVTMLVYNTVQSAQRHAAMADAVTWRHVAYGFSDVVTWTPVAGRV